VEVDRGKLMTKWAQHGLYKQVAFKNARAKNNLNLKKKIEVGRGWAIVFNQDEAYFESVTGHFGI
jgi:hypothetical protein